MNILKLLLPLLSALHPGCTQPPASNDSPGHTESCYVPAVNGTRLVVDVHFSAGLFKKITLD